MTKSLHKTHIAKILKKLLQLKKINIPEEIISFSRFIDNNIENKNHVTQEQNIVNQDINEMYETHLIISATTYKKNKRLGKFGKTIMRIN